MNRTTSLVAGLLLMAAGAFVLLRGADFTTRRDVVEVGDVKITTSDKQTIPPWAAGVALAAGLALVVAGVRKSA